MSEKNRLRQLNFTKRREAEGFKRILFWLKPDEKAYLKKALAAFRENAGEVELNPVKKVNPYQAEILKGEYPLNLRKLNIRTIRSTSLGTISVIGTILYQKAFLSLRIPINV